MKICEFTIKFLYTMVNSIPPRLNLSPFKYLIVAILQKGWHSD